MTHTRLLNGPTVGLASLLALLSAACSDDPAAPPDVPPSSSRAVIVAGDYAPGAPGVLSTLDPQSRTVTANVGPAMAVSSDPVLRHIGSELFIVNRYLSNNITILDDATLAFKEQLATGADSNPQDVAVVGDKLYVPAYQGKGVLVLTRGSTAITEIDLSADDPDGHPDCNTVYLVGTNLFVACQLLQGFPPTVPGKVYVVDTATDTVKTDLTMTLTYENPFSLFERIPAGVPNAGDLVISTAGDLTATTGCVERISTSGTPSVAGCLIENTVLGGYTTRIDFQNADGVSMMWSAVTVAGSTPSKSTFCGFDLSTNAPWDAPINPPTQSISDVAYCPTGETVVVDATANANGLRVYLGVIEQTTAPLPIGIGMFSQRGLICY